MRTMDVLVFSTVPVPEPQAGPADVITDPRARAAIIGEALGDLAEAGLTVTGPDVKMVHPLARHISRAQVIYRFARADDYTARQLTEFAAWGRYCVFRVGNGPFRNLDGENLSAPGKGIKVPVHAAAWHRRQKNLRTLRQAGLEIDEQIPVIPAEEEVVLRDAAEVLHRLGALLLLVSAARDLRAGSFPSADDLVAEQSRVRDSLTGREQGFLGDVGRALRDAFTEGASGIPARLRQEAEFVARSAYAVEALAWAVQLIDLPPQRLRAWDFTPRSWRGGPVVPDDETTATLLVRSPGLRGVTQLLEAFDLVHILHHGLPGEDVRAGQWTRALAWIMSPRSAWGEADRLL